MDARPGETLPDLAVVTGSVCMKRACYFGNHPPELFLRIRRDHLGSQPGKESMGKERSGEAEKAGGGGEAFGPGDGGLAFDELAHEENEE